MIESFKSFSIRHKFLFQITGPIFTIIASICYNLRKDDKNNPNDIPIPFDYVISIQFIWIVALIFAILSYFMFYKGLNNASDENLTLKSKVKNLENNIADISEKRLELESEYESLRANYSLFFDKLLSLISTNLSLTGRDRISVYFIPKEEEIFILLSRFSKNKTLKKKSNKNYNFKEGFIYQAIEEGDLIRNINSTSDHIEEYIKQVKNLCAISEDRIKSMEMKSRSYFIKTIDEETTETIGLIVLESLDVNKFNDIIKNETFNNYSEIIKEFISKHRNRFFSNLASDKGF